MSARESVLVFEAECLRLPVDLSTLDAFRRWARSDRFPERGRIDWLDGEVRIDMSPEDLNTHGSPKTALTGDLRTLVETTDRGVVYVDRARLTHPGGGLSSEPDVIVVFFETIESGKAQVIPSSSRSKGRFIEIQGAADLVVEILSDSSEEKDTERLPPLYYAAGVREFWRIDGRGDEIDFAVFGRGRRSFHRARPLDEGWRPSAVLGVAVRLVRLPARSGLVRHRLESR